MNFRVVIVEDEIRIREGVKKLLQKSSKEYEVLGEAEDGKSGLAMIRELKPEIIITDIRMSNMDGLEMLQQLTDEGISFKAIVLSAYSEFEYARTSMKLGVTEYLLKPIAFSDLMQALQNVEEQIIREQKQKPEKIGTLEQVLRDFLEGIAALDEEVSHYLSQYYHIVSNSPMIIVNAYLGNDFKDYYAEIEKNLQYIFSLQATQQSMILLPESQSIVVILYSYHNANDIERSLQRFLLGQKKCQAIFGCVEVPSIEKLSEGFRQLNPYMDWNIVLDEEILISYPKIKFVQTSPCIYPIETETKCKVAICTDDWSKVLDCILEFQNKMNDGKVYEPREVKECYVRFLWAIIGMAKEIGILNQDQLKQQILLETITNAKRRNELQEVVHLVVESMQKEKDDNIKHLTVKRVMNMIHEFYQTGITLEQISDKLKVTPEYIGTQFHKEVGMTFSAYMKDWRIKRAIELLCSTDLKQYQIAEQVGYADPKYFSKVFKEVTGQLPAEYRKTHK